MRHDRDNITQVNKLVVHFSSPTTFFWKVVVGTTRFWRYVCFFGLRVGLLNAPSEAVKKVFNDKRLSHLATKLTNLYRRSLQLTLANVASPFWEKYLAFYKAILNYRTAVRTMNMWPGEKRGRSFSSGRIALRFSGPISLFKRFGNFLPKDKL